MGLSSSMWSSVTGLLQHGEKMNVVSNNIANVSTTGFKSQRMDFADFVYQEGYSASGVSQIGRGVCVSAIVGDFSQGSFNTTNSGTDLAIGGKGYFQVRSAHSEEKYYTRAGDFYFNKAGQLINPAGYVLQGWKIDNSDRLTLGTQNGYDSTTTLTPFKGSGTPTDIVLDSWNIPPKATNHVDMRLNLTGERGNDKCTVVENPMTSLFKTWDAKRQPPISSEAYAYQTTITVYDEGGVSHDLTAYFDQITSDSKDYTIKNLPNGYSMYEYMVTMDPAEDIRTYGGTFDETTKTMSDDTKKFSDTKVAGVVMVGTLTFNSAGQLVNQTAYTYGAQDPAAAADKGCALNPEDMTSWQPTEVSSNGYPVFCCNFTGQPLANSVSESLQDTSKPASIYGIELNLGLKSTSLDNPWGANAGKTLADLARDGSGNVNYTNAANFASSELENDATTSYASSSLTVTRTQNGYTSGTLSSTTFDEYGVLSGNYSNGISLELYQITMYDFKNEQGLRREGGNLYSQTGDSGNPAIGVANDGGFGSVNAYALEESNVDLSREIVNMISTQRAYQANSKCVTTVDTMLETVINMKR